LKAVWEGTALSAPVLPLVVLLLGLWLTTWAGWQRPVRGDQRVSQAVPVVMTACRSQHRGGEHGLRLGRGEPVALASGQVGVAGGVDGVGLQGSPDRAPGREPELRVGLGR